MPATPKRDPDERAADQPPIPEPPNDGFPIENDVSIPPPDSDQVTGKHKKKEDKQT